MNKNYMVFLIIVIITLFAGLYSAILSTNKQPTAGIVVPQGQAMQQIAWTSFEAYDNWTGGVLRTVNGLTNVSIVSTTNSTLFISPVDHRLTGKPNIYFLRYLRFGNMSNNSAIFNVTLAYSYNSNGGNFTNITSSSFAAGNVDKAIDLTLTAGKAPLAFTGNSIVRLDMKANENMNVYMEIIGSQ